MYVISIYFTLITDYRNIYLRWKHMPLYICWRVLERRRHKRLTANPIKVEGRGFCIRREKLVAVLLKMILCMPAAVQKRSDTQSCDMNARFLLLR